MNYLPSLLMLAAVYVAVLASPGPNFFILSQLSLEGRVTAARWTAVGLASGSLVWVLLCLAGLSALFLSLPWLGLAVRWLGALYLAWYGLQLLKSAWRAKPRQTETRPTAAPSVAQSPATAYRVGLMTGLTNPKGAAFWTSAFATLLPQAAPAWCLLTVVLMVAALSLAWHLGITAVFGLPSLRRRYLRLKRAINGVAGTALLLLGLQRLTSR